MKRVNKKILKIFFIIVAIVFFASAHVTHAQSSGLINCLKAGNDGLWSIVTGSASDCLSSGGKAVATYSLSVIYGYFITFLYLILKIAAFIFWLVAVAFNFIIDQTVIHMRDNIDLIGALPEAWKAFRDLANIFFIFIILFIAISTILQINGFNTKKLLINLIIIALLINFSLFFTKVIIDASNYFSYSFYSALPLNNSANTNGVTATGLMDAFVGPLHLKDLYNYQTDQNGNYVEDPVNQTANANVKLMAIVLGIVVYLIAAFVFLAGAIIFIVRFLMLVILMIFSPVAFIAMILPQTNKYASQWWDKLFSEALVAPIFFMLIWVSLRILNSTSFLNNQNISGNPFVALASGSRAAIGVLFSYAVVIGFLIASLILAKNGGTRGGKLALQTFHGIRKRAQGIAGRSAVRGFGINALNKSFEKGGRFERFGNTRVGDAVKRATTGRLVATRFGAKESVKDIDKRVEEINTRRTKFEALQADKRAGNRLEREMPLKTEDVRKAREKAEQDYQAAKQQLTTAVGDTATKEARKNLADASRAREGAQKDLEAAQNEFSKNVR